MVSKKATHQFCAYLLDNNYGADNSYERKRILAISLLHHPAYVQVREDWKNKKVLSPTFIPTFFPQKIIFTAFKHPFIIEFLFSEKYVYWTLSPGRDGSVIALVQVDDIHILIVCAFWIKTASWQSLFDFKTMCVEREK